MNIGWNVRKTTWLFVLALLVGCAHQPSMTSQGTTATATLNASLGKTVLSADDLRDLSGRSAAERRRRLDLVLAAHPDDLAARFLRLQAEDHQPDFPAMIADSDVVLANPALDLRLRLTALSERAEALIQLGRLPEAVTAATEAVDIDNSNAEALFARGWARYLGDHGLAQVALADLNRALQLDSDEGIGYYRRAVIFTDLHDFDLAVWNLERASQLAPDDGPVQQQYGILFFLEWYSGRFKQSIDDYRKEVTRPHASSYAPLWLFIMRTRASPADEAAARAELAALAPTHEPREWQDTLVSLMLGRSTLDAALAEADASPTNQLRAGRRCEADYYAAERLLMHGEDISAKPLLEEAYWVCPSTYVEADAVVAERRLIEARSESR